VLAEIKSSPKQTVVNLSPSEVGQWRAEETAEPRTFREHIQRRPAYLLNSIGSQPGRPWRRRSAFLTGVMCPSRSSIILTDAPIWFARKYTSTPSVRWKGGIGVPEAICRPTPSGSRDAISSRSMSARQFRNKAAACFRPCRSSIRNGRIPRVIPARRYGPRRVSRLDGGAMQRQTRDDNRHSNSSHHDGVGTRLPPGDFLRKYEKPLRDRRLRSLRTPEKWRKIGLFLQGIRDLAGEADWVVGPAGLEPATTPL
jgi:hypothetical protein